MATLGWRVFPLRPGGKVPLFDNPHPRGSAERSNCRARCGRVGHGCWDATTDEATIDAWWSRTPTANVGVACGRLPGVGSDSLSSPDVVDIDVKAGAPGLASMERLRKAGLVAGPDAIVATVSGGWHLYFAGSAQGNGTLRGYGVDFRSLGGYVVAPPSVVADPDPGHPWMNQYRWAVPPGMRDPRPVDWWAIRQHLAPSSPYLPREPGRPEPPEAFARLVDWLAGQPEGNRNEALFWALCQALERGADGAVIRALEATARQIGLGTGEIDLTVRSARAKATAERWAG